MSMAALGALLTEQIVYLSLLPDMALSYSQLRPLLYAGIAAVWLFLSGRDLRPIPKGKQSAWFCLIASAAYITIMLLTGILFGFDKNMMTPNISVVLNNIWTYAAFAFLSEVIRYRLIKDAKIDYRTVIAAVLAIVYTIGSLRGITDADMARSLDLFFITVFPALALNAALSYIALEGSFRALLFISGAYSLGSVFIPVLPSIPKLAWAAVSSVLLFVTVILYRKDMKSGSRMSRLSEKRRAKYHRVSVLSMAVTVTALGFLAAFSLRVFPYFPTAVITESMSGAIERGSVVFTQKLNTADDVYKNVQEGDIILFTYKNVEVMHRVVEFRFNAEGERIYITKGDANPDADTNPVEMGQVVGLSRSFIPYIGWSFVIINALMNGG
ncbi:MAG: signal peptidase I [Oscillospiraceae bacterium]|nr:signal peptidase I [Oscillospiraceae bacterium]